mmetsp:Transcript_16259/g.51083  ORF Transcript_16259/g.51083 Transcript_16259/m.51083 type:complete len:189 (+) Transcript_16259:293-859(+)
MQATATTVRASKGSSFHGGRISAQRRGMHPRPVRSAAVTTAKAVSVGDISRGKAVRERRMRIGVTTDELSSVAMRSLTYKPDGLFGLLAKSTKAATDIVKYEKIVGRASMLGVVSALAIEKVTNNGLFTPEQLSSIDVLNEYMVFCVVVGFTGCAAAVAARESSEGIVVDESYLERMQNIFEDVTSKL